MILPPIDIDDIKQRLLDHENGNTENLPQPGLTKLLIISYIIFSLGLILIVYLSEWKF